MVVVVVGSGVVVEAVAFSVVEGCSVVPGIASIGGVAVSASVDVGPADVEVSVVAATTTEAGSSDTLSRTEPTAAYATTMLATVPATHAKTSPTERFIASSCSPAEERGLTQR